MASIDERVVAMAFENAKFEQGVAQTMRTLSKLDTAIQQVGQKNSFGDIEKAASKVTLQGPMSVLDKLKSRLFGAGEGAAQGMSDIEKAGNKVTLEQPVRALDKVQSETAQVGAFAAEGFGEIEKAGNSVDMNGMSRALSGLGSQFTAMEAVALGAFANIGAKLSELATHLAKSFSIEPVKAGFENYETQINAVQTILANTGLKGKKGLGQVQAALNNLNNYANKTVYNFSEMAKNIGTFTAAGVDLKTATGAIKGIANLAAMSGSNSQQAATAMYQLSQAISSGRVGLQDWNSVVNAGMGGTVFQRALAQTAVAMGTLKDDSVKLVGPMKNVKVNGESFRNSIMARPGQQSWLTGKVLTTALQNFTGDMSQAQLVAQGFTKAQAKAITTQAKVAVDAATKIKTFSQLMQALKEEVASSWAQVWKTLFGDINQAKSLFSPLHIAVENFLRGPIDGFNKRLKEWAKLGGRTMLLTALKNAFEDIGKVLHTIHMAFEEVFPPKTGKDMLETTKHFANFIDKLKPSKEILDGLKRTFAGVFAVLHIGWSIIKGVIGVFGNLFGVVGKGAGGFLGFTGSIGDMLVALDKALTRGGLLKAFFSTLTNILRAPLEILHGLGSAFAGLFSDNHTKKIGQAGDAAKSFGDKLQPLKDIFAKIKTAVEKVIHVVNKLFEPFTKIVSSIGKAIANIGTTIGNALSGLNLDTVFHGVSTAFLGGIFLAIKKFTGEGSLVVIKPLKQVGEALSGLTGVLKNMQQALKAGIILAIATAILALAVGVKLLASINPEALTRAMTGVAIGLGELVGAIGILQGMAKAGGGISLAAIAGAMIGVAAAVVILAAAMKIFATMSWDQMEKGLIGVGGALTAVGLGMKMIGPSITLAAPGLLGVAVAMNVLAVAMKIFGSMSFGQIAQGILAISGALFVIGSGLEAMGPELILVGPGLIAAGFGLSVIAAAVGVFGRMNLKVLIQGILGMGAALGIIGLALWEMPPGPMLIAQAAGLVVAGVALAGIGEAIKVMGSMSLAQMAKGLVTLGAALFELAVGLDVMSTTVAGAAALLLAATALAVLTPVISILGTLDIGTLAKGLGAIAASLLVLGVVGGVASPGIAALGIALSALGLAVILIGAGVYLIVKALIMLGDASVKSTGIVIAAITAFVVAIPKMIIDFLKGLVDVVAAVAALGPKIVDSLTKIFQTLLQVVINAAPKIKQLIQVLVHQMSEVIQKSSPDWITAGWTLLNNLLKGIDQNVSKVVNRVASIITKFLNALANKAPDLTAAGARTLVAFLNGVANHISDVVKSAGRVVANFLGGIGQAIPGIVKQAVQMIAKFINSIADNLWKIRKAAVNLAGKFLENVAKALLGITRKAADVVINFVNGIAHAIHDKAPQLRDAFMNLAFEMADAFSFGLLGKAKDILGAFQDALSGDEDPAAAARKNAQNAALGRKADEAYRRAHHGRSRYAKAPPAAGTHKIAVPPVDPAETALPQKDTTGKFVPLGKKMMAKVGAGVQEELPVTMKVVSQALQSVFDVMHRETPPNKFEFMTKNIKQGLTLGLLGMSSALQDGVIGPIHALLAQNKDLRAFGQFLGGEFRQGLTGGLWNDGKSEARKQIEGSFNALKAKLHEEHQKLRDSINSDRDALKQELNAKDKDWGKIAGLRSRIAQERSILAQSNAASKDLLRGMAGEEGILIKLAAKYEAVAAKLQTAKDKLNSLKDDRKQAIQQYTDQFSALPDIGQLLDSAMSDAAMTWSERWDAQRTKQEDDQKRRAIDQVANYKKALQDQITATIKYSETLNKLRALGLDDVTYKKLLEMGTSGQEFASQLLSQGKPAVDSINKLDGQLAGAAGDIGKSAGHSLYDAAIQAAKGFVDGFKAEEKEIRELMTGIAKSMVTALKAALGIKSPSRVFAAIGGFSVQGLADGLTASSGLVQDAAAGVGNDAADALTNSLANVSARVQNGINTDLTITPVLDLTQVQKDASKIQDLTNVTPITAAASYGQAALISSETQATAATQADATAQPTIEVKLEQNNTSPKALDDIEIYRQTRNQLSQVKSALGLVTATNP